MSIQNTKLTNFQADSCRVTALGENKDTGVLGLYSIEVSIPDEGITLPIGTIKSASREVTNVFDSTGSFTAQTTQNEVITDRNVTLSLADDMVYVSANGNVGVEVNKNTIVAMLEGNSFIDGNSIIKIVGTNGTRLVEPVESGQDFKYFALQDGKLIRPQSDDNSGKPELVANTYVAGYNNYAVCVMLEFLQSFDSNTRTGYMIPYVLGSGTQFSENSDYNKFSVECQILSDVRNIEKFLIDGASGDTSSALDSNPTYKIDGTTLGQTTGSVYYATSNGLDFLPTVISVENGTVGDIICIVSESIGVNSKEIGIYQVDTTTSARWKSYEVGLQEGTQIFVDKRLTQSLEHSGIGITEVTSGDDINFNESVDGKGIVICKGLVSSSHKAVNMQVQGLTNTYILDIKDYNFSSQTWDTL